MRKLVIIPFVLIVSGIGALLHLSEAKVEVGNKVIGHNPDRINNLFGVHSLFWAVQDNLSDTAGEMTPQSLMRLREAGVDLIRHGGGINEIDWSKCIGPVAERQPQKVMSWAMPIPCRFGIAEYEHVNDQLGAKYSWHMSNLVGFEFKKEPLERMASAASGHAQAVKALSRGRQVYWELGNELGDGVQKWSAEEIGDRAVRIASVIRAVDPAAKFVVPLLTFRPAWVKNDLEFNHELAERVKHYTSAFALHTYYDNAPEGPRVSNRLKRIADTSAQLRKQGFLAPELWVTEHSRWPAGNPGQGIAWQGAWYQAADFDALLSSAEFMIGLTQLEDVDGAMWHVLNGGAWSFLLLNNGEPVLSPLAHLFKLLQPRAQLDALSTVTYPAHYMRGYLNAKVRATVLKNRDSNAVYIWLVNRSDVAVDLPIKGPMFKHDALISASDKTLQEGPYDALSKSMSALIVQNTQALKVSKTGSTTITVPARAVLNIELLAN